MLSPFWTSGCRSPGPAGQGGHLKMATHSQGSPQQQQKGTLLEPVNVREVVTEGARQRAVVDQKAFWIFQGGAKCRIPAAVPTTTPGHRAVGAR